MLGREGTRDDMATCRTCKGVGSYAVQIVRARRYEIQVCYVCEGSGVVVPHDLIVDEAEVRVGS